jgi:heme-degrading monooxygenase HmoA
MIAVIFEVRPEDGRLNEYLDVAAELRPMLDMAGGFISIERFQSLKEPLLTFRQYCLFRDLQRHY